MVIVGVVGLVALLSVVLLRLLQQSGAGVPTVEPSADVTVWDDVATTLKGLPELPSRPYVPGYQRGCKTGQACSFGPAWSDDTDAPDGHNGCGTRDDVLAEQLTNVQYRDGSSCVVIAGVLHDPYTGATVAFTKADAAKVQVDHVVPLSLAWHLGAAEWSPAERAAFANDTELGLVATSAAANQEKSDSGPGSWLPSDASYRCPYVARFTRVLAQYQLPVVSADRAAMLRILAGCG